MFTPDWWFANWNQYGLLKTLTINYKGTFVDGLKISDVKIGDFRLDSRSMLRFRMEVKEDSEYVGGMTLFGNGFGNYSQGIRVRLRYSPIEITEEI